MANDQPLMGGWGLLRNLKRQARAASVPKAMLSAPWLARTRGADFDRAVAASPAPVPPLATGTAPWVLPRQDFPAAAGFAALCRRWQ